MENESTSPGAGAALGRWWGQSPQPSPSTDVMNQLCRVCGEPAAGFHFGAFTCEGCKSFFGRTYNNLGSITECKNNGECVINKKNRTACKACRLRKCLLVGMSKSGSRYGRRSNWFKIHCLLQEQQQAVGAGPHIKDKSALAIWGESYKNISAPPPHFDSDSKGSPTEESITLNNNNLSKDRERSPNAALSSSTYPAEAAAALWAARHSLFPMQLPHHHVQSIPMPFIPSFANFPPPGHVQPQRNILLPFIQNFHSAPSPQSNHQPLTVSSSPSRSPSICSQSPSPGRNRRRNSSPGSDHPQGGKSSPDKPPIPTADHPEEGEREERRTTANIKFAEEHSLALLRSLGPMQETPMDLSVRVIEMKNRRKSKTSQRITTDEEGSEEEEESAGEVEGAGKDRAAEAMDSKDENFNKRKIPLDLTKSTKVEI